MTDRRSRRNVLKSIAIGGAALGSIGTGAGQSDDPVALLEERIETVRDHYDIPGVSVAVSHGGEVTFAEGYGSAGIIEGSEVDLTPCHRFRVASISKPITAVAVLVLVDRGELGLDEAVFGPDGVLYDYGTPTFADGVDDPGPVTVRSLLTHTSGFDSDQNDVGDVVYPEHCEVPATDAHEMGRRELISWVLDEHEFAFEPETTPDYDDDDSHQYENFNYMVLGEVIERVSGTSYAGFVRDAVLEPCGIRDLATAGTKRADRNPREVAYHESRRLGSSEPYGKDLVRHRSLPHGGWVASPEELVQFADGITLPSLLGGVLSFDSIEEMTSRQGADEDYGLGWHVEDDYVMHNGSLPGCFSSLRVYPGEYTFAICANRRPLSDTHHEVPDEDLSLDLSWVDDDNDHHHSVVDAIVEAFADDVNDTGLPDDYSASVSHTECLDPVSSPFGVSIAEPAQVGIGEDAEFTAEYENAPGPIELSWRSGPCENPEIDASGDAATVEFANTNATEVVVRAHYGASGQSGGDLRGTSTDRAVAVDHVTITPDLQTEPTDTPSDSNDGDGGRSGDDSGNDQNTGNDTETETETRTETETEDDYPDYCDDFDTSPNGLYPPGC
ncbi:serine hydrolase domain-containing protein [Halomicrobium salinisoli]|uniref:serine hydrolase domain-containing protein n=1 Tax=Halomicrobium salinisoli TaxID=2878391 RepID=UPI001CF04900|nr:serine hydrolase domain-containing protein [Halomicrobium salinisoli]